MPEPKEVSPEDVLKLVAEAVPKELHENIIVIGSLAAAYWLLRDRYGVRTKDVDSVVSPRVSAVDKGRAIAERLLAAGWAPRAEGDFGKPGDTKTPDGDLPAMRLYPPGNRDWFFELLTESASEGQSTRNFTRFIVNGADHYGLPSFPYTSVATFGAQETPFGIRCAVPEMMALANLLEHPEIRPDLIKDTGKKRSNKDLGRVLAIARLSPEREMEAWGRRWRACLQGRFPKRWRELAARTGNGLRALITSEADMQQASEICNEGLLASQPVTAAQLRLTAQRLLLVVGELENPTEQ